MNRFFARNLRAMVLILAPLFLQFPAMGSETIVPAGCDAPPSSSDGRSFYIDPVHGSMANDGSAQRPWSRFADVVAQSSHLISSRAYSKNPAGALDLLPVNPEGPVKPGDTLVLMSGDHGEVDLSQYQNEKFIFVVAGENQTPIIRAMRVLSSTHWVFKGIKFQDARRENSPFGLTVLLSAKEAFLGPGGNIVFQSNSFSTQDNASNWTSADWVNKPYALTFQTNIRCTTLVGNHFYNVRNAVQMGGNDGLAMDNLLEDFGNDAFDITASNLTIRHNTIRSGHHGSDEPLHADGIQGWTYKNVTNRNVVIDSNVVINLNRANDNYMQGISIFDGSWDGVYITNNVVITNTWHGITLYGVKNAKIINNTVLPARPQNAMTWINVHAGKDNTPATNVVVRNNIAGGIMAAGSNITVDHNIALGGISISKSPRGDSPFDGVAASLNLDKVPPNALFKDFDMSVPSFDLRLSPNSLARKTGSEEDAPAIDVEGRPRIPPMDIGAYAR
ncbi:right-handed parallel beta-helix repeat-containing protein [uncultured Rhodoblastus sp.]|uniref:right-handed parallel beta-helix repeat-containing protein n=1 Tax=uncultured Rhodoblastus sp. TaxID=543037 RepID=UPI0025E1172B|nr:right-handed parallel beta-helix repeat-containing protein [uncultured Rhodoblastus sp.]